MKNLIFAFPITGLYAVVLENACLIISRISGPSVQTRKLNNDKQIIIHEADGAQLIVDH